MLRAYVYLPTTEVHTLGVDMELNVGNKFRGSSILERLKKGLRGCSLTWLRSRLLPKLLVKKALNAKSSACFFCQKSAKIMLVFLKSAYGLQKNAHSFRLF